MPDAPDNPRKPSGVDLDAMTIQQLTALRDDVEAKRREKLEAAKQAVLSETRAKLAELGLTLEAALPPAGAPGAAGRPRKPVSVPVKYQGPNGEKWSGRGRLPKWVEDQEMQGKSRDDFLTQKAG